MIYKNMGLVLATYNIPLTVIIPLKFQFFCSNICQFGLNILSIISTLELGSIIRHLFDVCQESMSNVTQCNAMVANNDTNVTLRICI